MIRRILVASACAGLIALGPAAAASAATEPATSNAPLAELICNLAHTLFGNGRASVGAVVNSVLGTANGGTSTVTAVIPLQQ